MGRKPRNSIIVFSAESGTTARDGVFTPALIDHIETPEASFRDILTQVRRSVFDQTDGEQIPGSYDQLFETIYLNAGNTD